ncbi:hypothetical protein G7067_11880 [Leucobacter insecticola]|uniref:Uncharacterized protein n=1 Tax=Leucobacter insecticola TaxID=2714934 RepID=A0A6G8FLI2_9MICO|nr:hypothetical protein [Leucobacter insecticola]QIM16942.1 hypothetical protein G7067_11880 [Leucobacter insecticola]
MLKTLTAWIVGLMLAALYVYAAVAAVGNLIGMIGYAERLGLGLSVSGWAWLIAGIALPILILACALWTARRRAAWARILFLAVGVAVVSVVQIDVMYAIPTYTYFGS